MNWWAETVWQYPSNLFFFFSFFRVFFFFISFSPIPPSMGRCILCCILWDDPLIDRPVFDLAFCSPTEPSSDGLVLGSVTAAS